ncbi:hypothetical protein BDZ89DRAFT_1050376 [Hymenopellis radicata]|nr:hypothetical protein BDZ89DRAFT_1050376 [Hymenopellis radicata]
MYALPVPSQGSEVPVSTRASDGQLRFLHAVLTGCPYCLVRRRIIWQWYSLFAYDNNHMVLGLQTYEERSPSASGAVSSRTPCSIERTEMSSLPSHHSEYNNATTSSSAEIWQLHSSNAFPALEYPYPERALSLPPASTNMYWAHTLPWSNSSGLQTIPGFPSPVHHIPGVVYPCNTVMAYSELQVRETPLAHPHNLPRASDRVTPPTVSYSRENHLLHRCNDGETGCSMLFTTDSQQQEPRFSLVKAAERGDKERESVTGVEMPLQKTRYRTTTRGRKDRVIIQSAAQQHSRRHVERQAKSCPAALKECII